jgi:hypothetical protein
MITVRELCSRIRTAINRGTPSATSISNRYIYNILKTIRNKVIYENEKNTKFNREHFLQSLGCVQLIEADINECELKPNSGCYLLRSKKPIPLTIGGKIDNLYDDRMTKYSRTSINKLSGNVSRFDFIKRENEYFIKNYNGKPHLYLLSTSIPKWLNIEALFEDEQEVKEYCKTKKTECYSILDTPFFIDNRLTNNVIMMALDELYKTYQRSINDTRQNSLDETGKNV